MSEVRTVPWESIADWFAKHEQAIRDVMKFEGLRGAVNEVLRLAPDQPELAALQEELAQSEIRSVGKSKLIDSLSSRLERSTEKCASLVDRNARLKCQRNGTRLKLDEAERRNAELLELLNNPTDEMLEAGNEAAVVEIEHDSELGSCGWISNSVDVLKAMLDAALNKPEEAKS